LEAAMRDLASALSDFSGTYQKPVVPVVPVVPSSKINDLAWNHKASEVVPDGSTRNHSMRTAEVVPHEWFQEFDSNNNDIVDGGTTGTTGTTKNDSKVQKSDLASVTDSFVKAVQAHWPGAKLVDQRIIKTNFSFIQEAFEANEQELETEMYAMINGYLFRDPEEKISKAGKTYVKATLKEGKGDDLQFVTVMAFSGTNADALMQGHDGDAVSVTGELKMRCFEKDGTWRPAADILANKVTILARPPRRETETSQESAKRTPAQNTAELINDDIPF
jgi:single-stranded DNA-binding protein